MSNLTEVHTVTSGKEKALHVVVALWIILGVAGYHLLSSAPTWQRAGLFVIGLLLAAGTFAISEAGKRVAAYLRDSRKEVGKMVWPKRNEALQLTGYVFAFVLIVALYLWLGDKLIEWVLYRLILGWTH